MSRPRHTTALIATNLVLLALLVRRGGPFPPRPPAPAFESRVVGQSLVLTFPGAPASLRPAVLRDGQEVPLLELPSAAGPTFAVEDLEADRPASFVVEVPGRRWTLSDVTAAPSAVGLEELGPAGTVRLQIRRPVRAWWAHAPLRSRFLPPGLQEIEVPEPWTHPWTLHWEERGCPASITWDPIPLLTSYGAHLAQGPRPSITLRPEGRTPVFLSQLDGTVPVDGWEAWRQAVLTHLEVGSTARALATWEVDWRTLEVRSRGADPEGDACASRPPPGLLQTARSPRGPPAGKQTRVDILEREGGEPARPRGDVLPPPGEFLGSTALRWPTSLTPGPESWLLWIQVPKPSARRWYRIDEVLGPGDQYVADLPTPGCAPDALADPKGEWLIWRVPAHLAPNPGTLLRVEEWSRELEPEARGIRRAVVTEG